MTAEELRSNLLKILSIEDQSQVDWQSVECLCDETIRPLVSEEAPDYPHDIVFHFLDDSDVRQKDLHYATEQRERLRKWLEPTG